MIHIYRGTPVFNIKRNKFEFNSVNQNLKNQSIHLDINQAPPNLKIIVERNV